VIAVCGEALIDLVGGSRKVPHAGGGPFNTARALARLGVPTAFIGRLSTDWYGRMLARLLEGDAVNTSMATRGPEPTTMAIADLDAFGHATYSFFIEGTSAPNLTFDMLPPHLPDRVRGLHVGTLGLLLEPLASTVVELVQTEGEGRLVMVDPNVRPALIGESGAGYRRRLEEVIARSTIVKASEEDLAWLYPELDYVAAVEQLLMNDTVALVIATLGKRGAYGATHGAFIHVEAPVVTVVDSIGAGDAFGAALLAWLHYQNRICPELSLDLEELGAMLTFACLVSAVTCTRAGAESPTRGELAARN